MVPVWYAAYGSNLLQARFLAYLRGGRVAGSSRDHRGARDPSDPLDDRPYRLGQPLVFGNRSRTWDGGGICFVDAEPAESIESVEPGGLVEPGGAADPVGTLGRAWLVTFDQLADVWAQENGATEGPTIDPAQLIETGSVDFGRGWYRRLILIGHLDGHPVATFTCAVDQRPELNPADQAYLAVVGRGVRETWGYSAEEAAHYLVRRPGNAGHLDARALARLLA